MAEKDNLIREDEIPQIKLLMYLYKENVYQRVQIQLLIGTVCTLMATAHGKAKGDELMKIFDSVPNRLKDELANIERIQPFYDGLSKLFFGKEQN